MGYGQDMSWQTNGYPTPVPDRYANMRGNAPIPSGFYTPPAQEPFRQNPMQPGTPQASFKPAVPPNSGIFWGSGRQEVDSYSIDPGCAAAFWDKTSPVDSPVIYLLQADSMGRPFTKTYDLVERIEGSPQQPVMQFAPSQYVRVDELAAYIKNGIEAYFSQPSAAAVQKENNTNA